MEANEIKKLSRETEALIAVALLALARQIEQELECEISVETKQIFAIDRGRVTSCFSVDVKVTI